MIVDFFRQELRRNIDLFFFIFMPVKIKKYFLFKKFFYKYFFCR